MPTPVLTGGRMMPCIFGSSCSRPGCKFMHPPTVSAPPCHRGYACSGRTDGTCKFLHPPVIRLLIDFISHVAQEPCKYGLSCTKQSHCPFAHGKRCRFGTNCTNATCKFVHTDIEIPATSTPLSQIICKVCFNS